MLKFLAKKWVIGQLNSLLSNLDGNEKVDTWKIRLVRIMTFLNRVICCLDDNKITADEADRLIQEAKSLF